MPKAPFIPVLTAALISGGIFLLVLGLELGFIFFFLSTLPIFCLGLSRSPRMALHASFIAACVVAATGEIAAAMAYLLFMALPAWYITRYSLLSRRLPTGGKEWFPLGIIFAHLAVFACIPADAVIAFYAGHDPSLPQILSKNIHAAFADLQGDYSDMIDAFANVWSRYFFSILIWLWGLTLYAHGWVANRALAQKHLAERPDFEMRTFRMPDWVLPLLAISALASLVGSDSMRFAGQTTMVSLMLPYFFLGATLLHTASKNWPSRRFFLFLIYFMILAQFWPAMVLVCWGLWHHIQSLNKRLPEDRS